METAEIQASLQSPLFPRPVEDGDRRCDLIWASPVKLHFFSTLCAETLFPPLLRCDLSWILSSATEAIVITISKLPRSLLHILNSAFVGCEELCRSSRMPSWVHNLLRDLHNSYPTKAEFNNCFIIFIILWPESRLLGSFFDESENLLFAWIFCVSIVAKGVGVLEMSFFLRVKFFYTSEHKFSNSARKRRA